MKIFTVIIFTILLAYCMATAVQAHGNMNWKSDSAIISYDTLSYDTGYGYWDYETNVMVMPKVALRNAQAADAINETLSFESITGHSLKELEIITYNIEAKKNEEDTLAREKNDESDDSEWEDQDGVSKITPYVHKNADGMLSVEMEVDEVAALLSASEGFYPVRHYYFNFDLATGDNITIDSLVRKEKMPKLLRLYYKAAAKNYRRARRENKKEAPHAFWGGFSPDTELEDENLQRFYITDKGICFFYDYDFMHVDAGVAPDPVLCIPKRKLKRVLIKRVYGL